MSRRSFAILAALAVSLVPATVAQAAPAHVQVTCSGYGCDHLDPVATGCSAGSTTVTSAAIGGVGTVELRWSPTCQTNWSRVTIAAGGANPSGFWRYADIYRQSPAAHDYFDFNGNGSPVYGNMLYAPGCAWASGTIQNAGGWSTGTAVQPGC